MSIPATQIMPSTEMSLNIYYYYYTSNPSAFLSRALLPLHRPQLHGVLEAVVESEVREPLVPRLLRDVCVPVLATAAAPVLVHPPGPVVLLAPGAVPPVPIFACPPRLPLLDSMAIRVKVLVPFVAPLGPPVAL